MARKDCKRARTNKTPKIRSIRDMQKLVEMHDEKAKDKTRIIALHGLLHASSVHNIRSSRRTGRWRGWSTSSLLVETHRAIAASSCIIDMMICEMSSDAAPDAAGLADPATAPGAAPADPVPMPDALVLVPGAACADSISTPRATALADPANALSAGLANPVRVGGVAPADSVPTPDAPALADPAASPTDLVCACGAAPADFVPVPGAQGLVDPAAAPGAGLADLVLTRVTSGLADPTTAAHGAGLADPILAGLADAIAPRMLVHATRLMEAGAAFGHIQIGNEFVSVLVHGLGAKIVEAGQAILTGRHMLVAALANLHQVKYTLGQVWNMRVAAKDFKLL